MTVSNGQSQARNNQTLLDSIKHSLLSKGKPEDSLFEDASRKSELPTTRILKEGAGLGAHLMNKTQRVFRQVA